MSWPEARPWERAPPRSCSHSPPARMSSFKSLSHPARGEERRQPVSPVPTFSWPTSSPAPWGMGSWEALTFHMVHFEKKEKEKHSGQE